MSTIIDWEKQKHLFLIPKLLLHARFVIPGKSWPACLKVKETTLYACVSICSWKTKLDFLFSPGAIGSSSLPLKCSQNHMLLV